MHAMMSQILKPRSFREDPSGFEEDLRTLELLIDRWEAASVEMMSDSIKLQILMDMSPAAIRTHLTLSNITTYQQCRAACVQYLQTTKDWQAVVSATFSTRRLGSSAMDVDQEDVKRDSPAGPVHEDEFA